jgi:peptide/nickel transport system substrate-binding protein
MKSGTPNGDQAQRKPAVRGAQDINAQPVTALRDGGDLRIPVDALPTNCNPLQVNGARVVTWQLAEAILPGAFRDAPDGNHVLNEAFFDSVELTSKSPQVITYRIAEKAAWSTGRPITWEDLHGQWRALSGREKSYEGYSDVGTSAAGSGSAAPPARPSRPPPVISG